ncbi:restin-like protein [Reticulomyxa filosa]|uniref:Restin-like protein n=1 Tax=Reticulomyxa filosa TaxID=46433 RepID=X6LYL1_RETFI|nr:restin-like protein [Reticulomyxa filosa]|eukprot:ETO06252.1 restin-like protein [Reticulomyxa filosa]
MQETSKGRSRFRSVRDSSRHDVKSKEWTEQNNGNDGVSLRLKKLEGFELGKRVNVLEHGLGTIRFIGVVHFAQGLFIGVELDMAVGKHDGEYHGVRYFYCEQDHGIFTKQNRIELEPTSRQQLIPENITIEKTLNNGIRSDNKILHTNTNPPSPYLLSQQTSRIRGLSLSNMSPIQSAKSPPSTRSSSPRSPATFQSPMMSPRSHAPLVQSPRSPKPNLTHSQSLHGRNFSSSALIHLNDNDNPIAESSFPNIHVAANKYPLSHSTRRQLSEKQQQIKDLETAIEKLNAENQSLLKNLKMEQDIHEAQQKEMNKKEQQIKTLEETNEKLSNSCNEERVSFLEQQFNDLFTNIKETEAQIHQCKNDYLRLKKDVQLCKNQKETVFIEFLFGELEKDALIQQLSQQARSLRQQIHSLQNQGDPSPSVTWNQRVFTQGDFVPIFDS